MKKPQKEALMGKKICITLCISLFLFILTGRSMAGVNVNIGINVPPPPALVLPAPPELVVIPNTYAYFAPGIDVDIVFYHGYWYRPHAGYWYRARSYNGPWNYIVIDRVPRTVIHLPPDYRRSYYDRPHIPYGHVHKNWKSWERNKYWDKRQWKYDEREWKHERKERRHDAKERHRGSRERYKEDKHGHKDRHRNSHD